MITAFGLGFADGNIRARLRGEGFSDQELLDAGLICEGEHGYYDRFFHRVIFPIFSPDSRVIGFGGRVTGDGQPKYVNSRATCLFDKGRNLYGLSRAKDMEGDGIILCEGYMDVISLQQKGFPAVAPLGTALTEEQVTLLRRYTDTVYVSFDGDDAGRKAVMRAVPMLRDSDFRILVPEKEGYGRCKDPDELLREEGSEQFRRFLKKSTDGTRYEIHHLDITDKCDGEDFLFLEDVFRKDPALLKELPDDDLRRILKGLCS